jgi:uncharacterized membrane protein
MNKKIYLILLKIVSGMLDTVLPNMKNSIKGKEYNPNKNKTEVSIDWVRLISSFIVFILLLLNLIGLIDVKEIFKHVFDELQSNI